MSSVRGLRGYLAAVSSLQSGRVKIGRSPGAGKLVEVTRRKRPEGWRYDSVDEFLLRFGFHWTPKPLPKGVRFGQPKACFRNAFLLVERKPELTYVEGLASHADFPVHHAWAVNREGEVLDPTWRPIPGLTDPVEYFGFPFSMDYVKSVVASSKVWGVLYNWTTDRDKAYSYMSLEPGEFIDKRWVDAQRREGDIKP